MGAPLGVKWFRSLYYGVTHCCLWWRVNPDGTMAIIGELLQERGLIADLCVGIRQKTGALRVPSIDYTVADDAALTGKKHQDGETREQTFRNHGILLRLNSHDPIQGWTRISELLGSRPDGRPYLTIAPECVALIRNLTNAVSDPNDEESVMESDTDQPLKALRIGAMSRPMPTPLSQAPLSPRAVGHLVNEIRHPKKSGIAWG